MTVGPTEASEDLSPREIQVLEAVARGLTNPEIAKELQISPYTVAAHLKRVGQKLGTYGRAESVAVAMRRGVIQ